MYLASDAFSTVRAYWMFCCGDSLANELLVWNLHVPPLRQLCYASMSYWGSQVQCMNVRQGQLTTGHGVSSSSCAGTVPVMHRIR